MTDAIERESPRLQGFGERAVREGRRLYAAHGYPLAGVALVALGITVRLWNYFESGFWYDEAAWAVRIFRGWSTQIRPPGFVRLTLWLGELHNTVPVLRAPAMVAGIASMPVWLSLGRAAGFTRWGRALGLFVLALQPMAITLSSEFKPYSIELFSHLCLLALASSFLKSRRLVTLLGLAVVGALSPLFAWSVAMVLPWIFIYVTANAALRKERRNAVVACAAGACAAGSLLWVFLSKVQGEDPKTEFWGRKYDVFFLGDSAWEHAQWLAEKTRDTVASAGHLRFPEAVEPFAATMSEWLFVAASLLGLVSIVWRKQVSRQILWLGPWAATIALGALGLWPYGPFRTNLFLVAYVLLLVIAGLEEAAHALHRVRGALIAGRLSLATLLVMALLTSPARTAQKASQWANSSRVRQALLHVSETEARWKRARARNPSKRPRRVRPLLIMDGWASVPFKYYTTLYEGADATKLQAMRKDFRIHSLRGGRFPSVRRAIDRRRGGSYWLLTARSGDTYRRVERHVRKRCAKVDVAMTLPGTTVLMHCGKVRKRR